MEINMNTIEDVEARIREIIETEYPGYVLEFKDVQKTEGTRRGVALRAPETNVAPTYYIDPDYEDANEEARKVIDILIGAQKENVELEFIYDYEQVKPQLSFKLVNATANLDYLKDKLFFPTEYEDIVAVPIIRMDKQGMKGSVAVTPILATEWDIYPEIIWRDAKANAAVIDKLREMDFPVPLDPEIIIPFRIFTNATTEFGASVMIYPEFFAMLDREYPDGAYIIPSSRHEILVMKSMGEFGSEDEIESIKSIISFVNQSEVRPEDYLSNNLYSYNSGVVHSF